MDYDQDGQYVLGGVEEGRQDDHAYEQLGNEEYDGEVGVDMPYKHFPYPYHLFIFLYILVGEQQIVYVHVGEVSNEERDYEQNILDGYHDYTCLHE